MLSGGQKEGKISAWTGGALLPSADVTQTSVFLPLEQVTSKCLPCGSTRFEHIMVWPMMHMKLYKYHQNIEDLSEDREKDYLQEKNSSKITQANGF